MIVVKTTTPSVYKDNVAVNVVTLTSLDSVVSHLLVQPLCLKISTPITPHGMYFPSTPLPSLPSLLMSEKTWCGGGS